MSNLVEDYTRRGQFVDKLADAAQEIGVCAQALLQALHDAPRAVIITESVRDALHTVHSTAIMATLHHRSEAETWRVSAEAEAAKQQETETETRS